MTLTPIVLGTNPDRGQYVEQFMKDVPSHFRDYIYVAETWGHELGAIREGSQLFPRFAFLQDSMRVLNWNKFVTDLNQFHSAYIFPRPCMYAMVYEKAFLDRVGFPEVGQDKELSIHHETVWCDQYEAVATGFRGGLPTLYPSATDADAIANNRYMEVFGQTRLHLRSECGTIEKMKGTWR